MMIKTTSDAKNFLKTRYSDRKLSKLCNGDSQVENLFMFEYFQNKKGINVHNNFLLKTSVKMFFDQSEEVKNLIQELLDNNKFDDRLLIELTKFSIVFNEDSFYPGQAAKTEILWSHISEENKKELIKKCIFTFESRYSDYEVERMCVFFYEKGLIDFNDWDWGCKLTDFSSSTWRRIKLPVCEKWITDFLKNGQNKKSFEHRVEYLFTIPEFAKEFDNNPKWMFFEVGWGKFIDKYPRKYQQKYINKLMIEFRKKKKCA